MFVNSPQAVRYDIERILEGARVAQHRRDRISDRLGDCQSLFTSLEADVRRAERESSDLRKHLKDRDKHIKNLEAQLRPHLLNEGAS